MQQKHKIITLTSLIMSTTTSFAYTDFVNPHQGYHLGAPYTAQTVFLGSHGNSTQTGEGGESGEGGFDVKTLKTDDVAFGTALEVIHAHYLIGEKLYAIGEYDMAESFFGHPISEVLIELQAAFEFRHIESPEEEMYLLLEIAQQDNQLAALQAGIKKVIDKINSAFLKIEIADKKHHVVNIAQINAELIRRSKLEYFEATQNSDIGALQDSVGYFEAAYQFFTKHKSLYKAANSDKTDDLSDYLEQLAPFFKNFQAFDEKANHKKLAGIAAKLELGLANLQ